MVEGFVQIGPHRLNVQSLPWMRRPEAFGLQALGHLAADQRPFARMGGGSSWCGCWRARQVNAGLQQLLQLRGAQTSDQADAMTLTCQRFEQGRLAQVLVIVEPVLSLTGGRRERVVTRLPDPQSGHRYAA